MNRLTIDHQRVSHVRLDVEALRLTHPSHSPVYAPFRKLQQVVCFGDIQWSGEALHACFARQVQIQFFNKKGRLAAVSHSMGQSVDYAHPLLGAWLCPSRRARLCTWLQREMQQRLLSLLGGDLCQQFSYDEHSLWWFVSGCHKTAAEVREWDSRVEALLTGHVLERLRDLGLPGEVLFPAQEQHSLLEHITYLMLWPLRLQYPVKLDTAFHAPLQWLKQPQRSLNRDWQALIQRLQSSLLDDAQAKD